MLLLLLYTIHPSVQKKILDTFYAVYRNNGKLKRKMSFRQLHFEEVRKEEKKRLHLPLSSQIFVKVTICCTSIFRLPVTPYCEMHTHSHIHKQLLHKCELLIFSKFHSPALTLSQNSQHKLLTSHFSDCSCSTFYFMYLISKRKICTVYSVHTRVDSITPIPTCLR